MPPENEESAAAREAEETPAAPESAEESAGEDAAPGAEETSPAINDLDLIPYGELSGRNADDLLRVAAS